MPNLTLKQRVTTFFQSLIPVSRRTIYNDRQSPLSLASQMDVDQIHQIFSEAETGDVSRLFALYRDILVADTHMQTEWGKRKLAVLGDELSILACDDKNPLDVQAAEAIKEMRKVPGWLQACSHLLNSTLWPVALVEKIFKVGQGGYQLSALVPVPYELLDYSQGRLMIWETDAVTGYKTGALLNPDPARYIIHRGHLLPTSDNWGGPFRSLVFWWFFAAMDRDAWARFLERYGSPFLVGKFDQGDDESRGILESAFSNAARLFGLVISNETSVELKEASRSDAGDAFEKFHVFANKEKSKLILGQTMSAEAQNTGIGQGASPQQETVRQDIRKLDAVMLGMTLQDQLACQYLQINGFAGAVPRILFGSDDGDTIEAVSNMLKNLYAAGLQVSDASLAVLSERFGIQIERISPAPSLGMAALSLAAPPIPGRDDTAKLSQAFRDRYAPLRRMILTSDSPEEMLKQVRALSAGWSEVEVATLLEESLVTFAQKGVLLS